MLLLSPERRSFIFLLRLLLTDILRSVLILRHFFDWRGWCFLSLCCNHGLHRCKSIIKARFFKLHLQTVDLFYFHPGDETTSKSLDCDCSIKDQILDISTLFMQIYDFVLHNALILMQFSFHMHLLLLQLG